MKKLLASLLAMVMALSLAAPAFADSTPPLTDPAPGEDPPSGWTADDERAELAKRLGISIGGRYEMDDETWEWIIAHEKETKGFLDSGMDAYLKRLGYASLEDFNGDWLTGSDAVMDLLSNWVYEQRTNGRIAQFRKDFPELVEQYTASADSYCVKTYYFYETPEQYMEANGQTREEFVKDMVDGQIESFLTYRWGYTEDFGAAHPGMIAWFKANAYDYFAQEYSRYFDSAEELMASWGYTEAEFVAHMAIEQMGKQLDREKEQALLDQLKAGLGGVPGQTGVMIDGEYVKFPDAAPELANGRTMAPLRAVMEALGAEVVYNGNDDIRCTVNGVEYTFAVGSTAVSLRYVAWDGKGDAPDMEGLIMDCAPYIKNGRTYVPVRFFAEAFGYTVEWDSDFKTAVLTDTDGLVETIDKDFTILNGLLAKRQLPDAYKASASCTGTLTIFNSIDGDRNSSMTVSQELTASPAGMSETVKYDLSGLLELFQKEYGAELLDDTDEEQLAMLKALLSGTAELRMDQESGMLYISMPSLSELLIGAEAPKDAWFSMDMSEADMSALGAAGQGVTMGALIAASSYSYYPVYSYSKTLESAGAAARLLGDKQFDRKEDAVTLTIDKARLEAYLAALYGDAPDSLYSYYDMPREFSLTLTVKDSGAAEYSMVYRTPGWNSYYGDSGDMRVTLSGSADGLNANMTVELHLKNQFKLALTVKQEVAETAEQPQTTPPEGAAVIPMDGLPGMLLPEPEPPQELPYPDGGAVPMEPAA